MRKHKALLSLLLGVCLCGSVFSMTKASAVNKADSLWPAGKHKNKIVVISDLHLGVDDSFAENVANRQQLINFLMQVQNTKDVREVVIAGDFLDEWFLPLEYPPVENMEKFFTSVAKNNQPVLMEFENVMKTGIPVVYVVGNHDMNLEAKVLNKLLPGVKQPRDAKGLGRYFTGDRKEIVIEHGHRYDPYSAPDRVSNKPLLHSDATMYPPGYFYARVGTSWVVDKRPQRTVNYPALTEVPAKDNVDQMGAYIYGKTVDDLFHQVTANGAFADKIFNLKSCGFNGKYSLQDMYPVLQSDGAISAPVLFKNFQRYWEERQRQNDVWVPNSFLEAGAKAGKPGYFYDEAKKQYLNNPKQKVDVVVFGHTHIPDFKQVGPKIYVNAGTWVDHNSTYPAATRTFVVVQTGTADKAALYMYNEQGKFTDITKQAEKN